MRRFRRRNFLQYAFMKLKMLTSKMTEEGETSAILFCLLLLVIGGKNRSVIHYFWQ
jgi:hypothetical protein